MEKRSEPKTKRAIKQKVSSSLRLNAEHKRALANLGLSPQAINQLSEPGMQLGFIAYQHGLPSGKERKRQLKRFRERLSKFADEIFTLDEHTFLMNPHLELPRMQALEGLRSLEQALDEVLGAEGASGNPETDLDVVVYRIAEVLLQHGIVPTRHGTQFNEVVRIVFHAIGVDESAIEAAISKAWDTPHTDVLIGRPFRYRTIAEMIDQRQTGKTLEEIRTIKAAKKTAKTTSKKKSR